MIDNQKKQITLQPIELPEEVKRFNSLLADLNEVLTYLSCV